MGGSRSGGGGGSKKEDHTAKDEAKDFFEALTSGPQIGKFLGKGKDKDKSKPGSRGKNPDGSPFKVDSQGNKVDGVLGERVARKKGDWKELNKDVYSIKQQTRIERNRITDDLRDLSGRAKQDYIDSAWIANEGRIQDMRSQYQVYGKKSVQGRLLDQKIKGAVNIQNHIERAAGVRDAYTIPSKGGRTRVRGIDRFGRPVDP